MRRHRQREEARRTILGATEALLVEDGYEAFSMRRLAERCGYTAPTIYHHFGDKPGLLHTLLEERFSDLRERVRAVGSCDDAAETMRALAHAFVDFGMRNPTFYRLLMTPRPEAEGPPRAAEEARAVLEEPIYDLDRAGRLYAADVETTKQTVWVLLHGLIHLRLSRPDHPWSDDLVEVALDSLLRGTVRPRPAAESRQAS
ncbi:MAG: TetR/AcrR family transcriptional regulator [Myxococcota bacterium]